MDESVELLLNNRRFLYTLLARVFASEPDEVMLSAIDNTHVEQECTLLDNKGEHQGAHLWNDARKAMVEQDCQSLRNEYTRLFLGPGKLPAAPWESVYVSSEPLLFQESTLAVRKTYQQAGYVPAGYPHVADDHVAFELEFMGVLAAETCEAYTADNGEMHELLLRQQKFLDEHLLVWIDRFADRISAYNGASSFYLSFAQLAAIVCHRDRGVVEELLAL